MAPAAPRQLRPTHPPHQGGGVEDFEVIVDVDSFLNLASAHLSSLKVDFEGQRLFFQAERTRIYLCTNSPEIDRICQYLIAALQFEIDNNLSVI